MASSIAGTALWRCLGSVAPQPSLLRSSRRFPDPISLQLSLGSKQALIFVGHLRAVTLFPLLSVVPVNVGFSCTVVCQQRQEKQGPKSESRITQSRKDKSGDGSKFLAVTEGVCIVVAGASYMASLAQKSQHTATVESSSAVRHFFSKFQYLSTWQVPALWAALVINAFLRTMQERSSSDKTERKWDEKSIKDFTVDQRVGKLEDDVQSVAAIARMLSRHLEKLGVRFRVTRRTLRDPIQETATLALGTSEVVSALAAREDMLEAEIRETRRELRETQQLLVSMQESQEKQLELLVTAMTRTKDQARRPAGAPKKLTSKDAFGSSMKSVASAVTIKSSFAEALGGPKESVVKKAVSPTKTKVTRPQVVEAENVELKRELIEDNQNGRLKVTTPAQKPEKKTSTFKPDTSFTKEDFWANTPATSTADLGVEHEVVDYLTSADRTSDSVSRCSDSSQVTSTRLDSFFSGRKNINSYQPPSNHSTQDDHNPGFSTLHAQSGDFSNGSGKHREHTMGFGFSFNSGHGKDRWAPSESSPDIVSGGTSHVDLNNWSNLSGGDFSSGSTSGSPRQSNWSSTSAWDFTSASGSPRHNSWYSASSMDCSSGSGTPRLGEGIVNFIQAGFVDSDFMRDFKDGYVSS